MKIKKLIQSIASKRGGLAKIARARGKSRSHSSTQYPSFIAKIEDVEGCLDNLGYKISIEEKVKQYEKDLKNSKLKHL